MDSIGRARAPGRATFSVHPNRLAPRAQQTNRTRLDWRSWSGLMKSAKTTTLLVTTFALTIFLSAFLLFEVQPILSKYILPWFGGSPAVWTTCMVFFQTVLFT